MSQNLRDRVLVLSFVCIFAISVIGYDFVYAYTTDSSVYLPAQYTTFRPPAKGGSYTDAVFGTAIKRLTDSMSMTRSDTGGLLGSITPEYSTMSPFNTDNTRLILLHFSYFGLYDGAGNYLADLPFEINASSQPRWSRSDPNVLYYLRGNQFKQYNAGTNVMTVIRTFNNYTSITGAGESDICFDGKHFVLAGNNRFIFVYDLSTNTVGAALDTGGNSFDSLYITPNDNVAVMWRSDGTSRFQGTELFDMNMNFQRQLTRAIGHMDVTRDTNGDEILVWTNSNEVGAICNNGIVKVRLSDARQTCLISLDWSLAIHVSAPDDSGWAFVETYAPSDPIPPTGWKAYTNEFLQVKLDGSEVRRLAHHRSRPMNSYTYMPKLSVSRDSTRLVFGSNFGLQSIGLPAEYSDVYMIDLNVSSSGSGGTTTSAPVVPAPTPTPPTTTTTTTRVEQNGSGIAYTGSWLNNNNAGHSGGSAVLAMDPGSRATFSFNGTGANWIGLKDEYSGVAKVYVDGLDKGDIDTYRTPGQLKIQQYSITGLPAGNHTLTIEVLGRRNAASTGNWVWIDTFESISNGSTTTTPTAPTPTPVPTTATTTRVEQNGGGIAYVGTWSNNSNSMHSGGSAKLAMDAGYRATFTFTGTGANWIGFKDEYSGIARVYVDGILETEIDTYRTPMQAETQQYSITGLTAGAHTLMIEVTGRKNPASGGSWIWVDAFEVISGSTTAPTGTSY